VNYFRNVSFRVLLICRGCLGRSCGGKGEFWNSGGDLLCGLFAGYCDSSVWKKMERAISTTQRAIVGALEFQEIQMIILAAACQLYPLTAICGNDSPTMERRRICFAVRDFTGSVPRAVSIQNAPCGMFRLAVILQYQSKFVSINSAQRRRRRSRPKQLRLLNYQGVVLNDR
jgi:hypothetical protein